MVSHEYYGKPSERRSLIQVCLDLCKLGLVLSLSNVQKMYFDDASAQRN